MSSRSPTRLAECTWQDVETALEDGTRTVVVGVGAIEQHGPHLPLSVDALDARELSVRVAEALGDALAAPAIRPGCSGHHMAFPGTISLSPETLRGVVRDYCRSLDAHGFEHVVLLPTHGGNFEPVREAAADLDVGANVVALADLNEHMRLQREGLRKAGVDYEQETVHAGAVETSTTLAVDDSLVRTDRLEVGHEGGVSPERLLDEGFESITPNGVLGDPRVATADAGEVILETLTEGLAERVEAERADCVP